MDLQEIKKQLPHGAIKEIAERANLPFSMVANYFKGKSKKPHLKEAEILKTTSEFLKEYKQKRSEAINTLQEALNN